MHAAPDLAQKWSFKMYAQHLRARFVGFMLRGDIFGDALAAAANIIRAGGYGSGHERSGAVTSNGFGDNAQGFRRAFHHIASACAMDVHVNESGNGGFIGGVDFSGIVRDAHSFARADQFDDAIAHEYPGIGDFT